MLAALVVLSVAGCTDPSPEFPAGIDPDPLAPTDLSEPCSNEPPEEEPGHASLLFTLDEAGLRWVIYDDGTALTYRQATDRDLDAGGVLSTSISSPYDDGPGVWDNAYLAECDLEPLVDAAEEYFADDPDIGDLTVTDMSRTALTFYGPAGPQTVAGFDVQADERSSQQHADWLTMRDLIAALEAALRSDGTTAPVHAVQVRAAGDVASPGWHAPPLEEVLVDGCGIYTGQDAVEVVRYLTENGPGQPSRMFLETLPPGVPGCVD